MSTKKKKESKEDVLKEDVAPLKGIETIPDGDLKDLNAESIKPILDTELTNLVGVNDETVSQKEETVFIYCGPTNINLSRYTTYKNGYPTHLKDDLDKCKVLKSLFVKPEEFAEFEQNVVQAGSVENIWFEEAKKYFVKAVK